MKNIAHRGGAQLWPENTLSAFAGASALGADGAELDVQLSADGVAVVHHDFRLHPGYCRDEAGRWLKAPGPRIKDLTVAELQQFDLGRPDPSSVYGCEHPDVTPTDGARLPALEQVIDAVTPTPGFILQIELKSDLSDDSADPVALADAALAVVRAQGFLSRSIFVGFDWRALVRVKRQEPAAQCWFSTDEKIPGDAALFQMIAGAGGQGWFPWCLNLTAERAALARAAGLQLGAWTVNHPDEMRRLIELGVDAICTDRPDLLQSLE